MSFADRFAPYGGGRRAPIGALTDEGLARRLREYKRQVAKRYRVVEPEAIERLLGGGRFFVSAKYDGELWFLVKRGEDVALVAYNGRVLIDTPLVNEAAARLAGESDVTLAGELIATPRGADAGRERVQHVATALGHDELEETLSFHAFDLLEEDGADLLAAEYGRRLTRLHELLGAPGGDTASSSEGDARRVRVAETQEGDVGLVGRLFREWVLSDLHEGVVVRNERGITYKIKSTFTIDAVVIAYGERVTGDVHQVREISVALLREDGHYQLLGAVGSGLSEQDRVSWHQRLSALEVPSRFRLANREGTLSRFVSPEIVVEIRCSDLLATDSWDSPIRRMTLGYTEASGWEPVRESPTAVMIHPVFLHERADKAVRPEDVGMTQITSVVPLSEREVSAPSEPRGESVVVRRAVFRKETRNRKAGTTKVAVRKYAVIETHKGVELGYPPIVVFFTDYSPGRKEPLQTALRSASSHERADALVQGWLADNLKRGWEEVEGARVGQAPG